MKYDWPWLFFIGLSFAADAAACGASLAGHDGQTDTENHMKCANGTCAQANLDGYGFQCCLPWESCVCKYVGDVHASSRPDSGVE